MPLPNDFFGSAPDFNSTVTEHVALKYTNKTQHAYSH